MKKLCFLAFWSLFCCSYLPAIAAEKAPSALGQKVDSLVFRDPSGTARSLSDFQEAKVLVVAFLGTECPLAKLYGRRLEELQQEFAGKGVRSVAVFSNVQDSPAEIAAFAKEHGLTCPLLLDQGHRAADKFGATRTPEFFVLSADRTICYQGRFDDQVMVGSPKAKKNRDDVKLAVEELLADKKVGEPYHAAVGCLIGRVKTPASNAEVTFNKQISRIFQKRCVECHRAGEIGPFSLTNYADAVGWGEMILEVVEEKRMPPWFANPDHQKFSNDSRLTDEEKKTIRQWVTTGCAEGDPKDAPAPLQFTEGWNIPKPDLVVKMKEEPFKVPATGVIDYKFYVADLGLTEDKWVIATEARPSNRSVVHHILVYLIKPGDTVMSEGMKGSLLGAYAPGSPARRMPPGMARKIPAGSKVLFQMHYTSNGTEAEDNSMLGLTFGDPKDVKQEMTSGWAVNLLLTIPPNAANHPVVSTYRFAEDRLLLTMTPHMHVRGKAYRYEAQYPDGRKEILLDVPRYDFNWQIDYILETPKVMPKGTTLVCTGYYDNSSQNLSNPDPKKWVRWGDQTWEEMQIGWFVSTSVLDKTVDASKEAVRTTSAR